MESDYISTIGKSVIQHGYYNDRIYVMKFYPDDLKKILWYISGLRAVFQYSKIIIKIPKSVEKYFRTKKTIQEATIPCFYPSGEDVLFLSRFFSPSRESDTTASQRCITMQESLEKSPHIPVNPSIPGMQIRRATLEDIPAICSLYQKTFETYPFPIHDEKYLIKVMKEGTVFFVCDIQGKIAGVGSCEIDVDTSAVEMTDLATDLQFRGYGISKRILSEMETQMIQGNIHTAYTICRSLPVPVNRLFAHAGYQFGGTLINNTNICGTIESMNVWYKPLHRTAAPE